MTLECHELTQRADGSTEFAYMGEKAWHGLGNVVRKGATVEEMQKAAGMDWTLERAPVQYQASYPADNVLMGVPDRVVLYRSDTKAPMSIVSKRFQEVQPRESLEFFRELTETGSFDMETAGTMRGGRRLFACVTAGDDFELPGGDLVKKRLLFATACDGSMATTVKPTSIRVVCRNTMAIAMSLGQSISVRHNTKFNPVNVKERLRAISKYFDAYMTAAEKMAKLRVDTKRAEAFVASVLPVPQFGAVQDTRGFKSIMNLFTGAGMGARLQSAEWTMWGALNAVTEYVDHSIRARDDDTRLESATFGPGDAIKSRALALATAAVA